MAEKGAEYSRGKWRKEKRLTGEWAIVAGKDDENLEGYIGSVDRHFNVHLICSAVNMCISINKDNPLAVAEGMEKVIRASKAVISASKYMQIEAEHLDKIQPLNDLIVALSKIGGK